MTATFHSKNLAMQESILVFNQDCELVSQLPIHYLVQILAYEFADCLNKLFYRIVLAFFNILDYTALDMVI